MPFWCGTKISEDVSLHAKLSYIYTYVHRVDVDRLQVMIVAIALNRLYNFCSRASINDSL